MHDDHRMELLAGWLRSQPADAQLRWGSAQLLPTFPFATDWADLALPGFDGHDDSPWTWEIYPVPEAAAIAPSPFVLVAPYDVQVRITVNRSSGDLISAVLFDPAGNHHHVRSRDVARIVDGARVVHSDSHAVTYVRQLWSLRALQTAIGEWIVARSGRRDIDLQWDPTVGQPSREEAEQRLQEAGYYPLGNDLYLAPEVVEELFRASPERALRFLDDVTDVDGRPPAGD